MQTYKFEKLKLANQNSWIKRTVKSAHFKKTVIYALLGAVAGYALFYFGQGTESRIFWNDETYKNILMGFGFGIFLTNSPCARGRC